MVTKALLRRSPSRQAIGTRAVRRPSQKHSFLSPKCEVRAVDDKGGYAVYCQEPIAKGELLVVWSGTLVDEATLLTLPAPVRRHSLQVERNHFLVSLTEFEPADYVNHSCDPNAGLSGQIALVAMRDIEAGEEITYDYAMSDGTGYDEFECKCRSPQCRGWVTSSDWKLPGLWHRYDGYFSPYLAQRISEIRAGGSGLLAEPIKVHATAFRELHSVAGR